MGNRLSAGIGRKDADRGSSQLDGRPRHSRDTLRLFLLEGAEYSRANELPLLSGVSLDKPPVALITFSAAMESGCDDHDCFVHFFEDDYRFLRIWNDPKRYLPKLRKFAGVIMPDFSTCIDFPKSLKMWSCYRNQALGSWFQRRGLLTLPNARYEPGCDFLLEGLPRRSVIAICGRGLTRNVVERRRFIRDLKVTVDTLLPAAIVYYGSDAFHVLDYPRSLGVPVWVYPGCGPGNLNGGRSGIRE